MVRTLASSWLFRANARKRAHCTKQVRGERWQGCVENTNELIRQGIIAGLSSIYWQNFAMRHERWHEDREKTEREEGPLLNEVVLTMTHGSRAS